MNDHRNADAAERFQELERIDREKETTSDTALVRPMASPGDRVFGAQRVAVVRDNTKILASLKALAQAAGDAWYYRFPVRKKNEDGTWGQDWIEGPSIKLANDLARTYGNVDVDVRVLDYPDSWVFYARLIDLETGYSLTRPFQQRKSQRALKTGTDRALDIAFQIGASKAIRNVVCNALQTFADFAFEEARNSLVDKIGKKIPETRERIIARLRDEGIDVRRVERTVGRIAPEWLAPDMAKIIACMKAIADGMATWDETFPPDDAKPGVASGSLVADRDEDEIKDTGTGGPKHAGASPGAGPDGAAQTTAAGPDSPADAPAVEQARVGPTEVADAIRDAKVSRTAPEANNEPAPGPAAAATPSGADRAKPAAAKADAPLTGDDFDTSDDYEEHALAWIAAATSGSAIDNRYGQERGVRNRMSELGRGLTEEQLARIKKAKDARKAALAKG